MGLGIVLGFLAVAALAYITPRPDWFVVMRHATGSRRDGWLAAIGVQCGLLVHLTAAAVGVAALLLASAQAFPVLKLAGAAYLVLLGLRALRDSVRRADEAEVAGPDGGASRLPAGSVLRQAFVANVLNPKAALFFVAVLPQFVSPGGSVAGQVVVLGLLDVVLGLAWWAVFVMGIGAARGLLGARRSRVVVDRVAGVALIGLGGLLATSGRRVA
ncbi:lysine transporter LysE [Marmoricola sp. Leaf446]|uniref:LysE family translocator n=1 Tax=Marmoricola sp. Leaf446 TaxID=1736379 RepID=UPI0006F9B4F9|nr:LysE family translocator [Marmoricola sp. Leaf446]KQT94320.1 lysine transporter LysE [Marmoricola sp. Leaf446]